MISTTRCHRRGLVLLTFLFALLCGPLTWAHEIEVTFGGVKQTITSTPHKPYLVIGSIRELRQHYGEIKDVLPPMPFMMEGQWILPAGRGFRTFPHKDGYIETFSENCTYAVRYRPDHTGLAERPSEDFALIRVGRGVQWRADEGPPYPMVTDDGHVIAKVSPREGPLRMTIHGPNGDLLATYDGPRDRLKPELWSLTPIPSERFVIARWMHDLIAVDYEGNVVWHKQLTPEKDKFPNPLLSSVSPDPLGRGLIRVTLPEGRRHLVEIVDPRTGDPLWTLTHGPVSPPKIFSRNGRYAVALRRRPDLVVLDWLTGTELFGHVVTPDVPYSRWGVPALSESPLCLVVRTADDFTTSTVIDRDGQTLWRCTTDLGVLYHVISADASQLCIYPEPHHAHGPEFMLFYDLREGGN